MSTDPQSISEDPSIVLPPPQNPDNWWWATVRTPDGVHLYEVGDDPLAWSIDSVRGELSIPDDWPDRGGWDVALAPGRTGPEKQGLIEPKAYGPDGKLLPIKACEGTTLHLLEA